MPSCFVQWDCHSVIYFILCFQKVVHISLKINFPPCYTFWCYFIFLFMVFCMCLEPNRHLTWTLILTFMTLILLAASMVPINHKHQDCTVHVTDVNQNDTGASPTYRLQMSDTCPTVSIVLCVPQNMWKRLQAKLADKMKYMISTFYTQFYGSEHNWWSIWGNK
jgi:hypothetical protein